VGDDLLAIIEYCKKNKCRIPYTNKISKEPGMWLVKDSGVYLMAAGSGPKVPAGPKGKDGVDRPLVVYAVGHDPNKDKETWHYDREVCGGDDFAEFIPLGRLADQAEKGMKVVIDITPTELGVELFGKAAPAKPVGEGGKLEGKAKAKAKAKAKEADVLS
jgi:hypothetical protein